MPKFEIYATGYATYHFGEFEANNKEEAISEVKRRLKEVCPSLCFQCSRDGLNINDEWNPKADEI